MKPVNNLGFVIKARMNSNRLPGKVLKKICDRTCIEHLVLRLKQSRHPHKIIIATSTEKADDEIAEEAKRLDISCYRGSLDDVLGRVVGTLKQFKLDPVIGIDGDRAMLDVNIVDYVIDAFFNDYPKYDCLVNLNKFGDFSFPPGQVVYAYKAEALIRAKDLNLDKNAREHLYLAFFENQNIFHIKTLSAPTHWKRPDIRTAIDTPEDFEFNRKVFEFLYPQNQYFSIKDVIELVDRKPELIKINSSTIPKPMR
jgi:spore coat polysaccharide biosynthesis protein SpsF